MAAGIILTAAGAIEFYNLQARSEPTESEFFEENVLIATINTARQDQVIDDKDIQTIVEVGDARAQLVANFLERHNSPLRPYDYFGQFFVDIADKYHMDFRLLPAIAMQESNLCKAIPPGSHNCLGFGIHSRGTLGFESFEEGIETAAIGLKTNYIDQGLTTPEQIMRKYTPSSNGSWAASVNQWMAEMRYDDRSLGRSLKTDADVTEFVPLDE